MTFGIGYSVAMVLVGIGIGAACSPPKKDAPSEGAGGAPAVPLTASSTSALPPQVHSPSLPTPVFDPNVLARKQIFESLSQESLPGAEGLEKARSLLLARAKNEPVFFVQTPQYAPASDEIKHYRFRIQSSASPWSTLANLLSYFIHYPAKGNLSLLRDGYLYSEDPKIAYALVGLVGAHHLFDSERIWIQRGETLMHARRKNHKYIFEDGIHKGDPVRLLLLDRVGSGDLPASPALHRDFRALRSVLGFDRVRVKHIAEDKLVVDLRYGPGLWVTTLLGSEGPKLSLVAQLADEGEKKVLERTRGERQDRGRFLRILQEAMLVQVEEAPPFDEPRTEVGQQDGILRRSWRFAYERGRPTYHVYDDWYQVFDKQGRPRVPQVCVDFLLDTFERASGTWWNLRNEQVGRSVGAVDFEKFNSRNELRRARRFVEFAREHPEWFDVLSVSEEERIAMGNKPAFFSYLAKNADDYAVGDMVFIRGKTPWDPVLEHTHSFFVYETDPITGVAIAVAGNASYPAIWSWETEARRTPLRTLRHRIRPTLKLLKLVASGREGSLPLNPPSLSP